MNNKIKIYFSIIFALFLVACEPIQDGDKDTVGGAITVDQLDISATSIIVDGKKSNKVIVANHSPVLSRWNTDVITSLKSMDTILLFNPGENKLIFTGLNPDGTQITKTLTMNVESMAFPLPEAYTNLFGDIYAGKTWTWYSDDENPGVYGTGGFGNNFGPAWSDVSRIGEGTGDKFVNPEEEMVFNMGEGAAYTKRKMDGTILGKGKFKLDLTTRKIQKEGGVWSIGVLQFTGATILAGSSYWGSTPIYEFYVISLSADEMTLSYAAPGVPFEAWEEATFWKFKAK